jgi:hypothetical protein
MVRETVDEEEAISNQGSAFSQNQNLFTAKDAKEKDQGVPRTGANGRALEDRPKPVEWKPTPDMYRMDTPEGRQAYEARFGMKIEPWLDGASISSDPIGNRPTAESRGIPQ